MMWARTALSAALAVMLGGGIAAAQEPRRGGELRVAVTAEPPTLDCHQSNTFATLHHVAPHYSTLLRIDGERYPEIVGDLAERWEVSQDRRSYAFHLRPGVRFHDGSALTAADVVASYESMRNPPQGVASPRREMFAGIATIEAPDDRTVVFRLEAENPAMLTIFASPWNCIYSEARLREDLRFPERTVMGTGPFRFVEYVAGSHWVGRRFDQYFVPGRPYLDGFRNVLMTSSALTNALQGGQVDIEFRGISPPERDRLARALGEQMRFQESPFLILLMLTLNTERPPFNDARVRRALSLAIDRWGGAAALRRTTLLGYVGGYLRPGYSLAAGEAELEQWTGFGRDMARNREEARRLLRQAGVTNLRFTLANRGIGQPYTALGVFLIDQWRQVGITVEQQMLETATYFNAMSSGNFEAVIDFSTDFVDEPSVQWVKYLSSDRSALNYSRAVDRTVDALFERQRLERDPAARMPILRQMEARMLEEARTVPLFYYQRIVPMRAAVHGWTVAPSYLINQDLASIWLDR
jgi:peptide/nickel transport system substrate-binding protein